MKSPISAKYLNKLKSNLPDGGLTEVANRLNLSQSLVSKVFSGKSQNDKVIEVALQVIEEAKSKRAELESRISALS